MSYGNSNQGGGQGPPQPRRRRQALAPPQARQGDNLYPDAQVQVLSISREYEPEEVPQEPIEPEEIELRIRFGALIGIAGMALCCLPVGLFGVLVAASTKTPIRQIEDPELREELQKKANNTMLFAAIVSTLSLMGWGVALVAGC